MIIVDGKPYGSHGRRVPPIKTSGADLPDLRTIALPFRITPGGNQLRIELNGRQHFIPEDFIQTGPFEVQATWNLSSRDQIVIELMG